MSADALIAITNACSDDTAFLAALAQAYAELPDGAALDFASVAAYWNDGVELPASHRRWLAERLVFEDTVEQGGLRLCSASVRFAGRKRRLRANRVKSGSSAKTNLAWLHRALTCSNRPNRRCSVLAFDGGRRAVPAASTLDGGFINTRRRAVFDSAVGKWQLGVVRHMMI